MTKTPKKLEKGAVAKMRESYKKLRENIISKELEEALNPTKVPAYEAVAPKGVGVFDTLKAVAKLVLTELRKGG